eukprot:3201368-Pleurochrysis_carterae.AAC.1
MVRTRSRALRGLLLMLRAYTLQQAHHASACRWRAHLATPEAGSRKCCRKGAAPGKPQKCRPR